MRFEILFEEGDARRGIIYTEHGKICTPAFIPVGTFATVRCMSPKELEELGVQAIFCNGYHLYLRPGLKIIEKFGGVHNFMGWRHPILSDSGGYQIFSLQRLVKVADEGIYFTSHIDGGQHFLSAEEAVWMQSVFGADIIMPLDECVPYPCQYSYAKEAMERTIKWAKRGKENVEKGTLFGIIQGSFFQSLRDECAQRLLEIGFGGYAVGGLCVGEPKVLMHSVCEFTLSLLPKECIRHLMGVGQPEDIVEAVGWGADLFDCVIPTRHGRTGCVYTWDGPLMVKNSVYKEDASPIDEECSCYCCRNFSRAYIRHLFNCDEIVGMQLATLHNIHFMIKLMKRIREAIQEGRFKDFQQKFKERYDPKRR